MQRVPASAPAGAWHIIHLHAKISHETVKYECALSSASSRGTLTAAAASLSKARANATCGHGSLRYLQGRRVTGNELGGMSGRSNWGRCCQQ
eukprot:2311754-Prymnesium_polylepis.1